MWNRIPPMQYSAWLPATFGASDIRCSGASDTPAIALTFDDGPVPGHTERLLATLKEFDAHGTFFQVGERVLQNPELARQVLNEGHEIGHHSFTHPRLGLMENNIVEDELQKGLNAFAQANIPTPRWFRPPYGSLHMTQRGIPRKFGMRILYWNINARDYIPDATPDEVRARIERGIHPGCVIVMHDFSTKTSSALPLVCQAARDAGLKMVTVSELLG